MRVWRHGAVEDRFRAGIGTFSAEGAFAGIEIHEWPLAFIQRDDRLWAGVDAAATARTGRGYDRLTAPRRTDRRLGGEASAQEFSPVEPRTDHDVT
jgi:hypothetical protein